MNQMKVHLSYALGVFVGLILFVIGAIGTTGMEAEPIEALTILLEPLGFGATIDNIYWLMLSALGFWITLGLYVRAPAVISICLILVKIVILGGVVPLSLTIVLCLTVSVLMMLKIVVQYDRQGHDY